jgi:hypothetical protein
MELYAALKAPLFYGGVAREAMRGIENGLKVKVRTNVKGNGQECPFYTDGGESRAQQSPPFAFSDAH